MMPETLLAIAQAALLPVLGAFTRAAAAKAPASHPPALSLRAVVVPRKHLHYEIAWFRQICSYAEVACVVKNVSSAPITITTFTASWDENWGTDGPPARVVAWATSANMPYTVNLAPGGTYAKIVPISFGDAKVGRQVTFRVRFDTNPEAHYIWAHPPPNYRPPASQSVLSAPITMRVPELAVHCR